MGWVVLGQLGEPRLLPAIETYVSGEQSHAKALDADTKGPLREIHRRVGTTILFESSGGQVDKLAHLPELRFAVGEPEIDTTSIDSAAFALEGKAFFIRKVGSDGFQVRYQPTLKNVVNDRKASLDEDSEIKPEMNKLVREEFQKGATIPLIAFPNDSTAIPDSTKLTLLVLDPGLEWTGDGTLRQKIAEWTKQRGNPASRRHNRSASLRRISVRRFHSDSSFPWPSFRPTISQIRLKWISGLECAEWKTANGTPPVCWP